VSCAGAEAQETALSQSQSQELLDELLDGSDSVTWRQSPAKKKVRQSGGAFLHLVAQTPKQVASPDSLHSGGRTVRGARRKAAGSPAAFPHGEKGEKLLGVIEQLACKVHTNPESADAVETTCAAANDGACQGLHNSTCAGNVDAGDAEDELPAAGEAQDADEYEYISKEELEELDQLLNEAAHGGQRRCASNTTPEGVRRSKDASRATARLLCAAPIEQPESSLQVFAQPEPMQLVSANDQHIRPAAGHELATHDHFCVMGSEQAWSKPNEAVRTVAEPASLLPTLVQQVHSGQEALMMGGSSHSSACDIANCGGAAMHSADPADGMKESPAGTFHSSTSHDNIVHKPTRKARDTSTLIEPNMDCTGMQGAHKAPIDVPFRPGPASRHGHTAIAPASHDKHEQGQQKEEEEAMCRCRVLSVAMDGAPGQWASRRKVLTVKHLATGEVRSIMLQGSWIETEVDEGDVLVVVAPFRNQVSSEDGGTVAPSPCAVITGTEGLVITHPDCLVSATRVGDAFSCVRRGVLSERISEGGVAQAATLGTMAHDIFQHIIVTRDWSAQAIERCPALALMLRPSPTFLALSARV
jgi:hypothetical protein